MAHKIYVSVISTAITELLSILWKKRLPKVELASVMLSILPHISKMLLIVHNVPVTVVVMGPRYH